MRPPMKPPPGSLWPRSRIDDREQHHQRRRCSGAMVRKISVFMRAALRRGAFGLGGGGALALVLAAHQRQHGDARGHHHGDLAQRIQAAEVDEDDVDDVAPMRDRRTLCCVEEVAEPRRRTAPSQHAQQQQRRVATPIDAAPARRRAPDPRRAAGRADEVRAGSSPARG